MTETFTSAHRTVRMEVFEAPQSSAQKRPAIVLLHGSGGNTNFWLERLAPHLTSAGVSLFAPHYFDRTGTDRADMGIITDGVHVPQWLDTIDTAHHLISARPTVDDERIAFLGISLGAFLSLALATMQTSSPNPARMRCIVELSGGLVEPYASQATSNFPPTLIVHGEADDIVPVQSARDLDARLQQLGVPHETKLLRGEGHWFSMAAQLQIMMSVAGFLRKHL